MKIDLSPAAVEGYINEKGHLAEREAKRMWNKFFLETGVISYEDVLQEAYKGMLVTLKYFSKSKSPMAAFDPYLVLGIQGELKNWIAKTNRQFNYTFDNPEVVNNIPDVIQDLMPRFEDLEVITSLSGEALEFLSCIFSPAPALKSKIKSKVTSGKPYSKSILPVILDWLKIGYDEYNFIRDELKNKCVYTPLTTPTIS